MYYRGDGPAIPELIAGRVQVMFGSVVTWAQQIKAGTVRPLGVTSATRTQLLPDLPPIGQFVPGYEGIGWQGIGAPKNGPQTSSTSSTVRSVPGWLIPSSTPASLIWAPRYLQARPLTSVGSSSTILRNGQR